jgi:hypothetical protein
MWAAPLMACPIPSSAAAVNSTGSDSRPVISARATTAVTAARPASVQITMVRLSQLSASTPAGNPASSIPMACTAANSPARAGDRVIARTVSG